MFSIGDPGAAVNMIFTSRTIIGYHNRCTDETLTILSDPESDFQTSWEKKKPKTIASIARQCECAYPIAGGRHCVGLCG